MSTKKALLIGCNYINSSIQLQGCINDAIQWWGLLQDVYGFNESDIVFLRDDKSDYKPTRQRIISELTSLINQNPTYFCIIYSGHGTSIPDMSGDETDKVDECIVPCDYQTSGVITDDVLNSIINNNKSIGLTIFDCCRSGTVLDLPNIGIINSNTPLQQQQQNNKIICISGCKDDQNSAEVYNVTNMIPQGALSITLINALRKMKYYPKISELLNNIKNDLSNGGLTQQPILTSTYPIYLDTLFPLIPLYISSQQQTVSQVTALTNQIAMLTNQVTTLTNQVATLTRQNKVLNNQNEFTIIQNKSLNTRIALLNNQITSLTTQINTLKQQVSIKR